MRSSKQRWAGRLCACFVLTLVSAENVVARKHEGPRRNSILLNGWEFVVGDGKEGAEAPAAQRKVQPRTLRLQQSLRRRDSARRFQ